MADFINMKTKDGFMLSLYEAKPTGPAKAGIVILQEIFGVNKHIQEVCEHYASQGFHVLAPCLFDRAETGISLAYDDEGKEKGRAYKNKVQDFAISDISDSLALFPQTLPKIVIGYCWGGSLAWHMACAHDGLAGAISYYGGELPSHKDKQAKCPVQTHFGEQDATIPMDGVHDFIAAQPHHDHYIYDAGHGFNCDHRAQYNKEASQQAASSVTLFLNKILGENNSS